MCGIVAMIAKTPAGFCYTDLDMFKAMLVADTVRGEDSTGVFGVYKNKQARTLKIAAEPHNLFRCSEWGDFQSKAISSMHVLVGHNRYATRGAVNSQNAHPFTEGKIVLVHNGTLNNQKEFNAEVEVDSHAIAHAFNDRKAEEVLPEINGAFAFIWYDRETGKLNLTRNADRPLAFIETSSMIYIASEGDMLEWLVNRKSTKMEYAKMYDTNKIYTYDNKGLAETTEYEPYRPKSIGVPATYHPAPRQLLNAQIGGTKIIGASQDIHGPLVFKKGDTPLVKVEKMTQATMGGRFRVQGKTIWPIADIDFTGLLEKDLSEADVTELMGRNVYATGTVSGTATTVCGHSIFLTDVDYALSIQTYNGIRIPEPVWKDIVHNKRCDKCGCHIQTTQAALTSVKAKTQPNKYRIVCAECVTEALDAATEPKQQDCNHEIQGRQQGGEIITDVSFREIAKESTVH